MTEPSPILTVREAAQFAGVAVQDIQRWIRDAELPYGKRPMNLSPNKFSYVVAQADLVDWLERNSKFYPKAKAGKKRER